MTLWGCGFSQASCRAYNRAMPKSPLSSPLLAWTDGGPKSETFDDVYYSAVDGLAESRHVFLKGAALETGFAASNHFAICELGFGTGLNFLAALQLWRTTRKSGARLDFISIEKFPLASTDIRRALTPWPELAADAAQLTATQPPHISGRHIIDFAEDDVRLLLIYGDALTALQNLEAAVDAWFLDGFSPARNPEMWRSEIFREMARLSRANARVATFTVAGDVRRGLAAAGFKPQKTPGFGTKREMLTARFESRGENAPSPRAPWFAAPTGRRYGQNTRIAIIGAGIAGASLAYHLQTEGYRPIVLEKADRLGAGASGNPSGLVMPRLSLGDDAAGAFHRDAFLYAERLYRAMNRSAAPTVYNACGVLQLATTEAEEARCDALSNADILPEDHMRRVTPQEAGRIADVPLPAGGLFFPKAGILTPVNAVSFFLRNTDLRLNAGVRSLGKEAGAWRITLEDGEIEDVDIVIIANAVGAEVFPQANHLALSASRGQITWAPETASGKALKTALAFGPYVTPCFNGRHVLGATYAPAPMNAPPPTVDETSQIENFAAIDQVLPGLFDTGAQDKADGRAAYRCVTPDRTPIAGPVPDWGAYADAYGGLATGKKLDYPIASYLEGLYVLTGLGSRGLVTGPLCAAMIAAEIAGRPAPVDAKTAEALHPGRFFIRNVKRGKANVTKAP